MNHHTTITAPPRSSAPAPEGAHPEHDDADDLSADLLADDDHIHGICEAWAWWCQTRRYFGKLSLPPSLLGRLASKTRTLAQPGGPDAICSAELHAFHMAVLSQPEALDRQVFEMHYRVRPRYIKCAADALGVSRQHYYRLLRDFRRRAYSASRDVLADNTRSDRQEIRQHMPA